MTTTDPVLVRQRRLRLGTILGIGLVAALVLLTTTQNWWTVHLRGGTPPIPVQGTTAAPALAALALTDLALAAALAISGPVFRFILGVLQLLIGFTIVLSSVVSIAKPDEPSSALISKATSVSGEAAIDRLVTSVDFTAWGSIAIVFGVLTFLVGVWLLLTSRAWPKASRKYQAVRMVPADGPRDAVLDWDALSDGDDPTSDQPTSDGPTDQRRPAS